MPTDATFSGEPDLAHPWAARYRLPIVTTWNPAWRYELALVVPSADADDEVLAFREWREVWPTEAEAAVLAVALEYRMTYYRAGWAAQMRTLPLDVDGSTNTLVVGKTSRGWHYRRVSWRSGPLWSADHPTVEAALDAAFDSRSSWAELKAARADVFRTAAEA